MLGLIVVNADDKVYYIVFWNIIFSASRFAFIIRILLLEVNE